MEDQYLLHLNAYYIIDLISYDISNHIPLLVNKYHVYVILLSLVFQLAYSIANVLASRSISPKYHNVFSYAHVTQILS